MKPVVQLRKRNLAFDTISENINIDTNIDSIKLQRHEREFIDKYTSNMLIRKYFDPFEKEFFPLCTFLALYRDLNCDIIAVIQINSGAGTCFSEDSYSVVLPVCARYRLRDDGLYRPLSRRFIFIFRHAHGVSLNDNDDSGM